MFSLKQQSPKASLLINRYFCRKWAAYKAAKLSKGTKAAYRDNAAQFDDSDYRI